MTTIAQIDGKWYVVKSVVLAGMVVWHAVSVGYYSSEQARAYLADLVFGRV